MPKSIEQFDQGLDSQAYLVVDLLGAHPDLAYTAGEIQSTISPLPGALETPEGFMQAVLMAFAMDRTLDHLVERKLIDRKVIDGLPYYTIHHER